MHKSVVKSNGGDGSRIYMGIKMHSSSERWNEWIYWIYDTMSPESTCCWFVIFHCFIDLTICLSVRTALVPEPSAHIGIDEYTSLDTYLNKSVYARSLPPIPENCPLPMGVVGKDEIRLCKIFKCLSLSRLES